MDKDEEIEALRLELSETIKALEHATIKLADLEKRAHSTSFNLKERNKELWCQNELTRLIDNPLLRPEEIFMHVTGMLPAAFRFPEMVSVRLEIRGRQFTSQNFAATDVFLSTDLLVKDKKIGALEIFYDVKPCKTSFKMFLPEETDFLKSLAQRLANYVDLAEKG